MSRITPVPGPPTTKLTGFVRSVRGISSSTHTRRPSSLLDSKARANAYLPCNLKDLKTECSRRQLKSNGSKSDLVERLTAYDLVGSHGFHTLGNGAHRPLPVQAAPIYRTIPLMQGFQTSAPKSIAHDSSTIDYAFLPTPPAVPPTNPFSKLRVPLLPDNYNPDRSPGSMNAMETLDSAIPSPEISVVASHPDQVTAAMSEVVGNDGLDVDIGQLTSVFSNTELTEKEPGVVKELWESLVDDIFGSKGDAAQHAV